jgi:hypothetical protein
VKLAAQAARITAQEVFMARRILVVAFAMAALSLPALAQQSKLNGTWKLNNSKSDFGQFPPSRGETDTIALSGSDFKQQVTSMGQQGTQTITRACAVDGKEVTIAPDDPRAHIGAVTLSKVQCSRQGNSVVILETANLRGVDLTDKLTFSASDDGQTMTMDSHIASATINGDRKLVYDKVDASAASAASATGATAPATGTTAMVHPSSGMPNLSGTWKLSLTKSNFGELPGPVSQIDTIEHSEPSVKIGIDQKGGMMGDFTTTEALTTDGKESTSAGMAGSEVKSTAHWDGSSLVVDSKTEFQASPVAIKDTFTVSPDGKTLTEVTHVESGMGNFDSTSVFEKQ